MRSCARSPSRSELTDEERAYLRAAARRARARGSSRATPTTRFAPAATRRPRALPRAPPPLVSERAAARLEGARDPRSRRACSARSSAPASCGSSGASASARGTSAERRLRLRRRVRLHRQPLPEPARGGLVPRGGRTTCPCGRPRSGSSTSARSRAAGGAASSPAHARPRPHAPPGANRRSGPARADLVVGFERSTSPRRSWRPGRAGAAFTLPELVALLERLPSPASAAARSSGRAPRSPRRAPRAGRCGRAPTRRSSPTRWEGPREQVGSRGGLRDLVGELADLAVRLVPPAQRRGRARRRARCRGRPAPSRAGRSRSRARPSAASRTTAPRRSPGRPARRRRSPACIAKRSACSSGSFSSLNALPSSIPPMKNSNRSTISGRRRCAARTARARSGSRGRSSAGPGSARRSA